MESCREPPFDAKKVAEQWPELESEQQASIKNDWIWQAVVLNYYVEDDLS